VTSKVPRECDAKGPAKEVSSSTAEISGSTAETSSGTTSGGTADASGSTTETGQSQIGHHSEGGGTPAKRRRSPSKIKPNSQGHNVPRLRLGPENLHCDGAAQAARKLVAAAEASGQLVVLLPPRALLHASLDPPEPNTDPTRSLTPLRALLRKLIRIRAVRIRFAQLRILRRLRVRPKARSRSHGSKRGSWAPGPCTWH
jgi:hypothetical protein